MTPVKTNPTRSGIGWVGSCTGLRIVAYVCAGLLFVALIRLPIGYYTFLRIAVTTGALLLLHHHWKRSGVNLWVVLFGAVAMLYNPILPIYLGDRTLWLPFNLAGGALFAVAVFGIPHTPTRTVDQ